MPLYKVIPTDPSFGSAEVEDPNTERILGIVKGLECGEADVFVEDTYAFSVRIEPSGIWSVFEIGRPGSCDRIRRPCHGGYKAAP